MEVRELSTHQYYTREVEDKINVKKGCIYGAGAGGEKILRSLRQAKIPVSFFIDRDLQKTGQEIDGVRIITPAMLVDRKMEFNLILAIELPSQALGPILAYIENQIFAPLGTTSEERVIYRVAPPLTSYYASHKDYAYTNHWFWSLCYDRVENFSYDYVTKLIDFGSGLQLQNGILKASDRVSEYVNYKDGKRLTFYTPQAALNHIYFLGDSRAAGSGVEDKHTIASFLQQSVQSTYEVVNYGCNMFALSSFFQQLKTISLKKNDVVVFSSAPRFIDFVCDDNSPLEQDPLGVFAFYLMKMRDYCRDAGAGFFYLNIPCVDSIQNKSAVEQYITDAMIFELPAEETAPMLKTAAGCNMNALFQARESLRFDVSRLYAVLDASGIPYIDLIETLSRPHPYGETYIDRLHLSPNGNKVVADVLAQRIQALRILKDTEKLEQSCLRHYDRYLKTLSKAYDSDALGGYIRYVEQHRAPGIEESGCIVMNCNPFTSGHRYVVEYAAKQVDWLYIFVLSEDKSQFPFEDRLHLVREGTKDLPNVTVLKSGQFIISALTMPEYFVKDVAQDKAVSCFDDLFLFAYKIAPILHIKKRFAGTEPFCAVTGQYNKQMREMLPSWGVAFVEVPRLRRGEREISASEVRGLFKKQDFKQIKKLVPESTYAYLLKRAGSKV